MFTIKQLEAIRHIRDWILHQGRTPSIRELMAALGYKSPRSAQDILEQLESLKVIKKLDNGEYQFIAEPKLGTARAQTVKIPLVGTVSCGTPVLAEENIEGYFPVSTTFIKPNYKFFLLRASGDSMNAAGINDGDFVLIRQQPTAEEGDNVVALIDDQATIKEFHMTRDAVVLKPNSTNPEHKPIILTNDFEIQGVVIAVIPNFE